MIKNILVVCMGNICRSPMAEALLRHQLSEKVDGLNISSAGITAMVNHPAALLAQEIMLEKKGINISSHRARQIDFNLLSQADLILVMELAQQKQIEFKFPSICGRVQRLGMWGGFDIPDPYQRPKQIFEQTLALIEHCTNDWLQRLWK